MLATNVFILFFDRQPDFQPYFFVVGTQSNSSILSNFRRGRGYSGVSPGNGFCPVGGEIRCSLSLWTGEQRVMVFYLHSRFSSHPPTTTFNAQNGTFSWAFFKFFVARANKKANHIHNRTSRTAFAPLVFILVCVCNRLLLFQSVQPIQLALP